MTELQVTLVPYTDFDTVTLAKRIRELAWSAEQRMRIDFPQVLTRYATVQSARDAVQDVKRAMLGGNYGFGAYVVEHDGTEVGGVSYQQRTLWRWRGWGPFGYPVQIVKGPLLAAWLGDLRSSGSRLLPDILKAGVKTLAQDTALNGYAWTLVRPSHAYVQARLADNGNGFGGFRAIGDPADYSRIDGVKLLRTPWVAYKSMQQLTREQGA